MSTTLSTGAGAGTEAKPAVSAPAQAVAKAAAKQESSPAGTYTVQVSVTVTDADSRIIPDLTRDQFEIFEDGEQQPITQFSDQRVPVSLGVMLDGSDSMRGPPMIDARAAVDRFVGDLLDPGDQAFVGIFNHLPRVVVPWTQPPAQLRGKLAEERPSGEIGRAHV